MQFIMPDLAVVLPGENFLSGERISDGNLRSRDPGHAKPRSRPFQNQIHWNKLPMGIIIDVYIGDRKKNEYKRCINGGNRHCEFWAENSKREKKLTLILLHLENSWRKYLRNLQKIYMCRTSL